MKRSAIIFFIIFFFWPGLLTAQKKKVNEEDITTTFKSSTFSGLKWRSIGPAVTSGRIADFAVNPDNPKEYFVAVASGHVWKTVNAGITYEPVFDKQGAYSMGVVTMDPTNHNCIWIGTGENNHQREKLKKINEELVSLENNLDNLQVPWTPGRIPFWE